MVENSVLLDVVMEWRILTRAEKKALQREVERLREKVKVHWKEPPLGVILAFWQASDEISLEISSLYGHGTHHPIEMVILQAVFTPEALAWEQTCQHLMNALNDPIVKRNPVTVHFIQETLGIARSGEPFTKENELFEYLHQFGAKQAASMRASKAAKSKNIEPRAWVLIQWASRPNKAQSKADFARKYIKKVMEKFGLEVTPNTIERSWLPKG